MTQHVSSTQNSDCTDYMLLVRNYEAYDANPFLLMFSNLFIVFIDSRVYVFLLYLFIGLGPTVYCSPTNKPCH